MFDVRLERGNGERKKWRYGEVAVYLPIPRFAHSENQDPSILLPKTSQIILDNVVLLDKGSASVNAPLPLDRKITSAMTVSHSLSHE